MAISQSARASRRIITKKFMKRWLLSQQENPFMPHSNVIDIKTARKPQKKALSC